MWFIVALFAFILDAPLLGILFLVIGFLRLGRRR